MPGNIVTHWSFRSHSGAIGPVGVTTPAPPVIPPPPVPTAEYQVVPVVWFASNTSYDVSAFITAVEAKFLEVRQFFYDRCDQETFDMGTTLFYRSPLTYAQCRTTYGPLGLWAQGMADAQAATPGLDLSDPKRYYCLITPVMCKDAFGNGFTAFASSLPAAALWGGVDPTVTHHVPGGLILPAGSGRLLGSGSTYLPIEEVEDNAPAPYPQSHQLYQALLAHEMVHGFGSVEGTNNAQLAFADHSSYGQPNNLLNGTIGLNQTLAIEQITPVKASPFITLHSTRP